MSRSSNFLDALGYSEYDPESDDHYDSVGWNDGGAPDVRATRTSAWAHPNSLSHTYALDEELGGDEQYGSWDPGKVRYQEANEYLATPEPVRKKSASKRIDPATLPGHVKHLRRWAAANGVHVGPRRVSYDVWDQYRQAHGL